MIMAIQYYFPGNNKWEDIPVEEYAIFILMPKCRQKVQLNFRFFE